MYFRFAALALFVIALLVVGIGFYRARSNTEFRMVGFPTALSKDVVASVDSYERREIDGETVKFYIKADKATTFADNHQELENVYLQVFDSQGAFDEITSAKAVYVPEENKNFTGYFAGNVNISTRDKLRLKTEQITYKKADETAIADEAVTFERANIKGKSFGSVMNLATRSIELRRDVEFEVNHEAGGSDKITAGHAVYFQNAGHVEFANGVRLMSSKGSGAETTDATANRVVASLNGGGDVPMSLRQAEFVENVRFVQTKPGGNTTITCNSAIYEKAGERFDLKENVVIEIVQTGSASRTITGNNAVYASASGRVEITGNAQAITGSDWVKGNIINADLRPNGTFKNVEVLGNANLRQVRENETTDITADEARAIFNDQGSLTNANSKGKSEVRQTSPVGKSSSNMSIVAASGINAVFKGEGMFERVITDGRTTINLETPDNGRDSSNKQVTADSVSSIFNPDGKTFKRTEAVGNSEFIIAPHRASIENHRVKVNSPRIDCDFFAAGNSLNVCVAATNAKMVRTPTVARDGRGDQVVTTTTLTSRFDQASGNIAVMEAVGKARFSELDRNGSAQTFVFTANDEIVKLRGGEPTAWDSRARLKAKEIDWDTKNARSSYRGSVGSTYYSANGLGKSSPFGNSDKPVYVTSESADLDHSNETARYTGNARAWQGGSYVRASTILVSQKDSKMDAEGSVQSALFNAKSGSEPSQVPVFASADSMHYDGKARTVRYEQNVVVKKGPDRFTGRTATAWLDEKNELTATDFEHDVVIVQPNRKGSGEFARYTSADEKLVLRGRPARVEDPEKGSLAGAELTIFMKDKRVLGTGVSKDNPAGRVRNTYKIQ